jgi:ribonuclease D
MIAELPAPILITTTEQLRAMLPGWQREALIALDTESNSLFAYREQICLVQLSTRSHDYLIDPITVDLEPLRPLFADPAVEKVFHASEYDLICLKRDFDFVFANVFDTMFAARVLGRKQFGLAALLIEFFDVQTDKHFQRADWSLRPLPPAQLQYAQQDTHYLPVIRDELMAELEAAHQMDEARELFDALSAVQPGHSSFDEDGYWRIASARDFNRRQMAKLRELYLWRDSMAQHANCPPFKIIADQSLTALIEANPRNQSDLFSIRGLPSALAKRYGRDLMNALSRGNLAPLPDRPERPPRPEPIVQARYDALQTWRKTRAAMRGVESDVIISKEAMWAMANLPPHTLDDLLNVPGLGPWRRSNYGLELLQVVANAKVEAPGDADNDESAVEPAESANGQ